MNTNNSIHDDKIIQVFSCDMLEVFDQQDKWKKGKLFIMEKSLHFCPLITFSTSQFGFNQKVLKLKYSQIKQFDEDQENDQLTLITHKGNKFIFSNFFQQRPQIIEILNNINFENDVNEIIEENDIYDWDVCNTLTKKILPELLQLKEGNQYNPPTVFEIEGLDIHEIFALLYDDIPYQPSQHFNLDIKEINKQKKYQNVLHFFFEQILGDLDIQCNPWFPQVPEYLRTSDMSKGPLEEELKLENLPTRQINYVHPTKLPVFGTITAKVKMIQKLLLLNQNEFIVQVISETSGLPKSDTYRMMSHEKAIKIGPKKFRIECTFTIEWKSRIMILSNQIDNAAAVESKRVLDTYYIPYAKARLKESLTLLELLKINEKQKEKKNEQKSEIFCRKQQKSETQVIGNNKFYINSAKNLDNQQQKNQNYESNIQRLETKISELQMVVNEQQKQIQKLQEEQQAITFVSKTFGIIIVCILLTNLLIN